MLNVAIVGRTNVGKSALFNRLLNKRESIVDDAEHTTRNNLFGYYIDKQLKFSLIDTGGLTKAGNNYYDHIFSSVKKLLTNIDIVLFIVDYKIGLTKEDKIIGNFLHKTNIPVLLCINKYDQLDEECYDFFKLGFKNYSYISVIHAININQVYDFILKIATLKTYDRGANNTFALKLCFLGLPNVGKSSLFNFLLKKERSIVSHIPKTTRNIVKDEFIYNGQTYQIIDTAGVVKRSKLVKISDQLYYRNAIKAIEQTDVVLLVLDCTQPILQLLLKIANKINQVAKPVILLLNKADLISGFAEQKKQLLKMIKNELYFLPIYQVFFVSAYTGENIQKIFFVLDNLKAKLEYQYSTNFLNTILQKIRFINQIHSITQRQISFKYIKQVQNKNLLFLVYVNNLTNFKVFQKKQFYKNFVNVLNLNNLPVKLIYRIWKK